MASAEPVPAPVPPEAETVPVCPAEETSSDRYVTRARPSFLYVIYVMILGALPVGAISAFRTDVAEAIAHGIEGYFRAFPEALYTLFGAGYLGYTAARFL